jgi:hypothetical protein
MYGGFCQEGLTSWHMCINMAKTIKEEKMRWVLPVARKEIRMVDLARVCPYGKRSPYWDLAEILSIKTDNSCRLYLILFKHPCQLFY